jgi:hypothetical protein
MEDGLRVRFDDSSVDVFLFEEKIMLIDDETKETVRLSDTFMNVVYEGYLRNKTHKEILTLVYDFVMILYGAESIKIEETPVSQIGLQYPKCNYVVRLTKPNDKKQSIEIENIVFLIN